MLPQCANRRPGPLCTQPRGPSPPANISKRVQKKGGMRSVYMLTRARGEQVSERGRVDYILEKPRVYI